MSIALVYLLLLLQVILHELWHARAMRGSGVRVVAAGLGLALPPKLTVTTRSGFCWTISPWLVGAYVQPHDEDWKKIDSAPYVEAAWQFNAGIVINLVTGLGCLAIGRFADGSLTLGLGALIACILAARFQKQVAAYLFPVIGPAALVLILWSFIQGASSSTNLRLSRLAGITPDQLGILSTIRIFGLLGLSLALLNAVPLMPLDNGRVWDRLIVTWFGVRAARMTGILGAAAFVSVALYDLFCDAVNLAT